MKRLNRERERWMIVVGFAVAMAWLEAATVYYIRSLVDRLEPYQANPLPIQGTLGGVELVREAATLVMLLALGMVAARTWARRLGYAALAFGVWDIFYYVFLRVIYGWPRSLFDWDVLFLLPLPWWGPVLAPMCIALLMIVWGTIVTQSTHPTAVTSVPRIVWGLNGLGIALALYVFMADALRTVHLGWFTMAAARTGASCPRPRRSLPPSWVRTGRANRLPLCHSAGRQGAMGGRMAIVALRRRVVGAECYALPARSASGTHRRSRGPVYSDWGRMMRCAVRCSMAWAIHPLTRLTANVGVNSGTSSPRP
jgi:hypothetical protein